MSEFEWDEAKNRENLRKHGISFGRAVEIFNGPILSIPDDRYDYGEERVMTFGMTGILVILAVVHTHRDNVTRIISARRADKDEQREFETAIFT
jgi:uncharacterized protein